MLPARLLRYHLRDGVIRPHFLGPSDGPWLVELLDEYERHTDKPRRLWKARLREPFSRYVPSAKLRMAAHVLGLLHPNRARLALQPKEIRRTVFRAAASTDASRDRVLAWAAEKYETTPTKVVELLFSDLPSERPLPPLTEALSVESLAQRTNLALTQGLLFRATGVSMQLFGRVRPVVRHAKLRGLICTIHPRPGRRDDPNERDGSKASDLQLDVSGPLSLFRRTLIYGRALAELVPFLMWCHRFELRATCVLRGRTGLLTLTARDPIFPGDPPKAYDSRLEKRFVREFGKLAPDWTVVREPEPVEADRTLVFPDFALVHRHCPERRWLLEIVGFWTPDYVTHKLKRLRAARLENLILCIDTERDCADGLLPSGARVIRFKRHIDAAEVLEIIEPKCVAID